MTVVDRAVVRNRDGTSDEEERGADEREGVDAAVLFGFGECRKDQDDHGQCHAPDDGEDVCGGERNERSRKHLKPFP